MTPKRQTGKRKVQSYSTGTKANIAFFCLYYVGLISLAIFILADALSAMPSKDEKSFFVHFSSTVTHEELIAENESLLKLIAKDENKEKKHSPTSPENTPDPEVALTPDVQNNVPDSKATAADENSSKADKPLLVNGTSMFSAAYFPVPFSSQYLRTNKKTVLILAIVAAAWLGACVSGAYALANHVGGRTYRSEWSVWYLLRPTIGIGVGLILYLLLRADLILGVNQGDNINVYSLSGVAGMGGLFSKKVLKKIEQYLDKAFFNKDPEPDEQDDDQGDNGGEGGNENGGKEDPQ